MVHFVWCFLWLVNNSVLSDGRTLLLPVNPRCDRKKEPVSAFAEQLYNRGCSAWRGVFGSTATVRRNSLLRYVHHGRVLSDM
jgi:hypothetical protein